MRLAQSVVETQGKWVECRIETCNGIFFRHDMNHPAFSLGDKIGVCPLCIFERKIQNGTLKNATRDMIVNYHHKSVDSKPEKDSL